MTKTLKCNKDMRIDFTKVIVHDLGGNAIELKVDNRQVANDWYFSARDIRETDMARSIYDHGYVELSDDGIALLQGFIRRSFFLPVQQEYLRQIDEWKGKEGRS